MRKTMKRVMILALMAMPIVFSGCSILGIVPGVEEYVETAQEGIADNDDLKSYVDELNPLITTFYKDGKSLEEMKVQGNEIYLKINLGEDSSPYDNMKDLMVYETTRVSHAIMTYRDYEVINDLYKINLDFTNQKEVVLYKAQAIDTDGVLDFTPETILNAVKR